MDDFHIFCVTRIYLALKGCFKSKFVFDARWIFVEICWMFKVWLVLKWLIIVDFIFIFGNNYFKHIETTPCSWFVRCSIRLKRTHCSKVNESFTTRERVLIRAIIHSKAPLSYGDRFPPDPALTDDSLSIFLYDHHHPFAPRECMLVAGDA